MVGDDHSVGDLPTGYSSGIARLAHFQVHGRIEALLDGGVLAGVDRIGIVGIGTDIVGEHRSTDDVVGREGRNLIDEDVVDGQRWGGADDVATCGAAIMGTTEAGGLENQRPGAECR